MGTIQHHVIIVTGCDFDMGRSFEEDHSVEYLHSLAETIFPVVSPILPSEVNGYTSFFIPPDGSKEGWEDSNNGDKRMREFLSRAVDLCCSVVLVSYGELGTAIKDHYEIQQDLGVEDDI